MFEPRVISHKKNYFRKNDKTKLTAKQYLFRSNINPYTNVSVWLLMWKWRILTVPMSSVRIWLFFGSSQDSEVASVPKMFQSTKSPYDFDQIWTNFKRWQHDTFISMKIFHWNVCKQDYLKYAPRKFSEIFSFYHSNFFARN